MHILTMQNSRFNELTVYDTTQLYGEMGKFRCLQFADTAIQGAMDLKDQRRVVLIYQRAIIHLMEFNALTFEHVFVIGHGIGTIAGHYLEKSFTIAEIDEKIVELSRQYFGYGKVKDRIVIGDGRQALACEQSNTYDYIILDAFTHKGTPLHFTTLQFFAMTMEKLKPRGAVIMNVMGKINNDRLINAMYSTLREVYSFTKAFSLSAEEVTDHRNMIFVASNRVIDYDHQDMAGFFEIELEAGHIMMD